MSLFTSDACPLIFSPFLLTLHFSKLLMCILTKLSIKVYLCWNIIYHGIYKLSTKMNEGEINAERATLVVKDYFEKVKGAEIKIAERPLIDWMDFTVNSVKEKKRII